MICSPATQFSSVLMGQCVCWSIL